jgi:GT2 family glycosyltransferase/2-polyprenyl-3-methyl-5-hydroxy-6-metoxy-1,4-benzoquinol methylase
VSSSPAAAGGSDLSVVIPTRNRWPQLASTLAALRAQTVAGFEVVVVVDGDELGDRPPARVDADRVLLTPHGGPGAARNRGVAATDRPLLLFLGDDMVPEPGLVAAHLAVHRAHPDDAVAALGRSVWHPSVRTSPANRWLEWSDSQFDFSAIAGDDAGWGRFYSSNVSLKRKLFARVGGFDEDFTYDYEDLDLAYRLHEAGLRLRFAPDALTLHLHGYDIPSLRRRYYTRGQGERMMSAKHSWFVPFFAERIRAAEARPPVLALWPWLAGRTDWLPERPRARIRANASAWYHQQLSAPFFGGWHGDADIAELREYLGDAFDPGHLTNHRALVEAEEAAAADAATFYRSSEAYLYDLTAFSAWGTKSPYLAAVRRLLPAGASVLDYGCGIGTDGIRLLEEGYRLAFADFDNPSTRYLRWRLRRRGLTAPVFDVESDVPGGHDAVICFDVIEHVEDPFRFLERLEQLARVVVVNLLEPEADDTPLHKALPVRELLARARHRGLLHYARYERRSHLVAYVTDGSVSARASRSCWLSGRRKILAERLTGLPPRP